MKYLFVLFLGIAMGIGGEFVIPRGYRYGQTTGCLKGGDYTLMLNGKLYYPKLYNKPVNITIKRGFIPSYQFLYWLLSKRLEWMSVEECSKVQDLSVDKD
jgi:hypothetical protein